MNLNKHTDKLVAGLVILAMIMATGCALLNKTPEIDSLTVSSTSIAPGGSCTLNCAATDPDDDDLSYTWSAGGGTIAGTGSSVTWVAPNTQGSYTISVAVTDGLGEPVSESISINVVNTPPQIVILTPSEMNVAPDDTCEISCTAVDADGDRLTYSWTASDGTITGTGSTVSWEAPGDEGNYTISVAVSDGRGGTDSDSCVVEVEIVFGYISVDSSPTGAVVYLDGEDTGNITPYVLANVEPGDHTVKLVMYHYEYREQAVNVKADETTYVNWSLTYAPEQTLTMQPGPSEGKDAYVNDATADTNSGNDVDLIAGSKTIGICRSYFQFDLNSLPDDAVILNAWLGVYYYYRITPVSTSIGAYLVTDEWSETNITWNNQPSFSKPSEYSNLVDASPTYSFLYWYIDDIARGWWDGSIPNYGVMLRAVSESSYDSWKIFYSSDWTDTNQRPKLVIHYYDPTP